MSVLRDGGDVAEVVVGQGERVGAVCDLADAPRIVVVAGQHVAQRIRDPGQVAAGVVRERDDGPVAVRESGDVPVLIIADVDRVARGVFGGLQVSLEIGVGRRAAVTVRIAEHVAVGVVHIGLFDAGGTRQRMPPAVGVVRAADPVAGDIVGQLGEVAVGIVHGGETVVAVVRDGDDARGLGQDVGDEVAVRGLDDRAVLIVPVGGHGHVANEHFGQEVAVVLVGQRIGAVAADDAEKPSVLRTPVGYRYAVGAGQPVLRDEDELAVAGRQFREAAVLVVFEGDGAAVRVGDLRQTPVPAVDLVHGPGALVGGVLKDGPAALEFQGEVGVVFAEILAVSVFAERVDARLRRIEGQCAVFFLLQAVFPVRVPAAVVDAVGVEPAIIQLEAAGGRHAEVRDGLDGGIRIERAGNGLHGELEQIGRVAGVGADALQGHGVPLEHLHVIAPGGPHGVLHGEVELVALAGHRFAPVQRLRAVLVEVVDLPQQIVVAVDVPRLEQADEADGDGSACARLELAGHLALGVDGGGGHVASRQRAVRAVVCRVVLVHGLVHAHDADGACLVAVLVDFVDVDGEQDGPHGGVAGVGVVDVETGDEVVSDPLRQVGRDHEDRRSRRGERDRFGKRARFAVRRLQHIVAFRERAGVEGQQKLLVADVRHHACERLLGGVHGDDGGARREAEAVHHECQGLSVRDVLRAGRDGCDLEPDLLCGQGVADVAAAVPGIQHHVDVLVVVQGRQRQLRVVDVAHRRVVGLARRRIAVADVELHAFVVVAQRVQRQLVGFSGRGGKLVRRAPAGTDRPLSVGQRLRAHGDGDGFHVALRSAGRFFVVDVRTDQQVIAAVDHARERDLGLSGDRVALRQAVVVGDGGEQDVRIIPEIVLGKVDAVGPFAVEVGLFPVEGLPLYGDGLALCDAVLGNGKIGDIQVDAGHVNGARERFLEVVARLVRDFGGIDGNRIFARHVDRGFRGDQRHGVGEHRDVHTDVLLVRRSHLQGASQRRDVDVRGERDPEVRQFAGDVHGLLDVHDLRRVAVHREADGSLEIRVQRAAVRRLDAVGEDDAVGVPLLEQGVVEDEPVALHGREPVRQGDLLLSGVVPQLYGVFRDGLRIEVQEEIQLECLLREREILSVRKFRPGQEDLPASRRGRHGVADVDVVAQAVFRADFRLVRQAAPVVAGEVDVSAALDRYDGVGQVVSDQGASRGGTRVQGQREDAADARHEKLFDVAGGGVDRARHRHVGHYERAVAAHIDVGLRQHVFRREGAVAGYRDLSVLDAAVIVQDDGCARAGDLHLAAEHAARQRGARADVNRAVLADHASSGVVHGRLGERDRPAAAANGPRVAEGDRVFVRAGDDQFALVCDDLAPVGHIGVNIARRIAGRGQRQPFAEFEFAVGVAEISARSVSAKADGPRAGQEDFLVS